MSKSKSIFDLPERDVWLLGISGFPFFLINDGTARYSFHALALVLPPVITMLILSINKPLFGWLHVAGRILAIIAGAWVYAGFLDSRAEVLMPPGGIGTVAQYIWYLALFALIYARKSYMDESFFRFYRRFFGDRIEVVVDD